MSFPFVKQPDARDCGPSCVKMVAEHYGKKISLERLRDQSYITREGVSFLGMSEAAASNGFRTVGVRIPFQKLADDVPLPCIVHWRQNHFVVVYRIKKGKIYVADPAVGLVTYTEEEFNRNWAQRRVNDELHGLCLILQPTPKFYQEDEKEESLKGFRFLFRYVKLHSKYFGQIIIGLLLGSVIQLILPFLTQSVIDVGINTNNLSFIYLVLFAQLALILGRLTVDFLRSWLLLHISTRVNVAIVSGFLSKLMSLPISFFDTKLTGDLMQRIDDNQRIEDFVTTSTLNILFSFFNVLVFGIVLAIYDLRILLVFLAGTSIYILWVSLFIKKRASIDSIRFNQMSANNSKLIDIINGMQEIKLTRSETSKRWDWENLQAKLFRTKVKSLSVSQYQLAGGRLVMEITNVTITLIAATAVLTGPMTLGMMLAVQFILGQLNVPVNQIIGFFKTAQDAKISLDRLAEIHSKEAEEDNNLMKVRNLPPNLDIYINNLSFQYEGPRSPFVLKNIDLVIPNNKITAIVGASGSGKTTLMKLILGFYQPVEGDILVGDIHLSSLSLNIWRDRCGVVMQDGYIFPDTITYNIAPGLEIVDEKMLLNAVDLANIRGLTDELPLGFNTRIGQNGHGLSQGQKQRILIARAIYKNPEFLFFDEATNSLDAGNEKTIVENLKSYYRDKTVLVIAHRLSTVRDADQIIVLDKGKIVERGNHNELTALKGAYFNLVKNQLELGS